MKYVNCGCGSKFVIDNEWINLDFHSGYGGRVRGCDLLKGLPFVDSSIDVVFSSCMLEHFTVEQARAHLKECYRVLKTGGIVRIVVPDLENVCKEYLKILELVRKDKSYEHQYEYVVIELLDQMTRMYSGGEMQKYWENPDREEEYILYRTGYPAGWGETKPSVTSKKKAYISFKTHKLLSKLKWYQYLCIGKFMLSGETHKWMYDEFSLQELLVSSGFKEVKYCVYNESEIQNWDKYGLEITKEGKEYKPHSLYMEGIKRQ